MRREFTRSTSEVESDKERAIDVYRRAGGSPRFPSALYAINTLGACSGVLACLFIFLPLLGHARMLWLLVGINGVIAMVFLVRGGVPAARPRPTAEAHVGQPTTTVPTTPGRAMPPLIVAAVLSGLLAGSLEGDMFKRIDFISSGDSAVMALISFWAILAIFLASWVVRAVKSLELGLMKVAWIVGLIALLPLLLVSRLRN